ncbi:O-antigen ligase family protein [Spirosoma rhododendri]|uniref:O-antigen ligase family protein n=1 Tax=Spirosoma rhododendri TaxID=2728024 RepID=A0A7L5DG84_9BACT|nr:O-antigen ligase family protein [Spirosoma rhododendri]QJD77226.1 O-antigen ligase family protein [Spirosoma rhododendri]
MKHQQQRSFLFLLFLTALLAQFGRWQGQINEEQAAESGSNSQFLLLYVPLLLGTVYVSGLMGYLKVFRPFKGVFISFLLVLTGVGLFRGDVGAGINNMASITLTYSIILGLTMLGFSLPFRRTMALLVLFIAFIFLPLTTYIHLTKVGPLVLFPDRLQENNLRLGGLLYYAHTAMLLGIGALFALEQLIVSRSKSVRLYYGLIFLTLNVFLLLTDCRSSWGGVGLSYSLLIFLHLSRASRWKFGTLVGLLVVGFYVNEGWQTIHANRDYHTSDDMLFRMAIWGFAVEGIGEQPLTGYGTENYFAHNQKAMATDDRLRDPHSATLSLALQSGLVAVVLFYWLYGKIIRHYNRFGAGNSRPMLAVGLFWLLAPFLWGTVYNGAAGFIQILFPLTFFLSLLHPGCYESRPEPRRQPIQPQPLTTIPLSYERLPA